MPTSSGSGGVDLGIARCASRSTALARPALRASPATSWAAPNSSNAAHSGCPAGVLLAALLNGVVTGGPGADCAGRAASHPVARADPGGVIAAVHLGVLFVIMAAQHPPQRPWLRLQALPKRLARPHARNRNGRPWAAVSACWRRSDRRGVARGETQRFSGNGVTLTYPAGWSSCGDEQPGPIPPRGRRLLA